MKRDDHINNASLQERDTLMVVRYEEVTVTKRLVLVGRSRVEQETFSVPSSNSNISNPA